MPLKVSIANDALRTSVHPMPAHLIELSLMGEVELLTINAGLVDLAEVIDNATVLCKNRIAGVLSCASGIELQQRSDVV